MATLAEASLTETERRVLERLVALLKAEFGPHLHGVWLYGSRARGEPPGPESDRDVLVVSSRGRVRDDDLRVIQLVNEAAKAEWASPVFFSALLYSPERSARGARSAPSSTGTRSSSTGSRDQEFMAMRVRRCRRRRRRSPPACPRGR